jgi:hypothetical protein
MTARAIVAAAADTIAGGRSWSRRRGLRSPTAASIPGFPFQYPTEGVAQVNAFLAAGDG